MSNSIFLPPASFIRFLDAEGQVLPFGQLLFYQSGTLTPAPVYDDDGDVIAQPVLADITGAWVNIFLDDTVSYRCRLLNAAGVEQGDADPVESTTAANINFIQSGTGAVSRSIQEKLRDEINAKDFGADATGAVDFTAKFQNAINQGNVTFTPGTYTMSWAAIGADINIPSNRKIIVQKGATITMTGGRFCSDNAANVEWQIDGWIKSVAMRTAATKVAWSTNPGERGFLEFGGDFIPGQSVSGFTVHGSGKVSGDWTGTPNFSDPTTIVNRKGIACFNAKNVLVTGLEVFGFDGEAIFGFIFDTTCSNIVFSFNNVHDTRFNALNFEGGANGGGCKIINNRVKNAYAIESSIGQITDNNVDGMIYCGIWTGVGAGLGPISISRNTISNSGLHGVAAIFASGSPVTGIIIQDNVIAASQQYSIYTDYVRELVIQGNASSGAGTGSGSYDIGVNHTLRGCVSGNTFTSPGGFSVGRLLVATSFDVSVDPNSNVYTPTTGTVPPYVGAGVVSVASAGALTLPVLGRIFLITGTTSITSIVATNNNGREVVLIFAGILTVTDGSNLKLNGDFVTTADDTVTLVCDGTSWFEICRSVN